VQRNELVALLSPKLAGLRWRRPASVDPGEPAVALAEVAAGILLRGPGIQVPLIITIWEWRELVRAIKAGEFDDTV
jgi:hypothetical protein